MKTLHVILFTLLVIGGFNWLLVGLFGWDIGMIFGGQDAGLSRIIYILVGLSAFYLSFSHRSDCKHCESKTMSNPVSRPAGSSM